MRILVFLSQFIVGILFIFSGFIKLNDPLGFSYKLKEYFEPTVLDLPFFIPYALPIAYLIVVTEIVLGVMLLVGLYKRMTVILLFVMITFFTFLTFYSAYFNKVTDCGCFGDAIPLTPWQSFSKDVVLMVLISMLLLGVRYIRNILPKKIALFTVVLSGVSSAAFGSYVYHHLPVFDFRPYAIGQNIREGMDIPDDAPKPKIEYHWQFTDTQGNLKEIVTSGAYPDTDLTYKDVTTQVVEEGFTPKIHDFSLEREGSDYTEYYLSSQKVVLVVAYDLDKAETSDFERIKSWRALHQDKQDIPWILLTASSVAKAKVLESKYDLKSYQTDGTTLKTMIRANPGIMVLENGTITQKMHSLDIDGLTL